MKHYIITAEQIARLALPNKLFDEHSSPVTVGEVIASSMELEESLVEDET